MPWNHRKKELKLFPNSRICFISKTVSSLKPNQLTMLGLSMIHLVSPFQRLRSEVRCSEERKQTNSFADFRRRFALLCNRRKFKRQKKNSFLTGCCCCCCCCCCDVVVASKNLSSKYKNPEKSYQPPGRSTRDISKQKKPSFL